MAAHAQIQTNIDGLDLILDGGLRHPAQGSLFVVILGGPGTGKTNLALELTVRTLIACRERGVAHLYYSLDQPPLEVHNKLLEDFEYFGLPADAHRLAGSFKTEHFSAVVSALRPSKEAFERHLVLASLLDTRHNPITGAGALFEKIDRDVHNLAKSCDLGSALRPRLVTVDNISLSVFDDGSGVRSSLRTLRDRLGERAMHGVFVVEAPPDEAHRAAFAAAEYAADVIIFLDYHALGEQFKERSIEIAKARHQFYYRGTHHFSIVGRSGTELRGARGQRRPGIHVYPSTSTLLSYLQYRSRNPALDLTMVPFGIDGVNVRRYSSNGLISPRTLLSTAHATALRFLLEEPGTGVLISFQQSAAEILESIDELDPGLPVGELERRIHGIGLDPEYISAGKFLKDVFDDLQRLRESGKEVTRVALLGLGHLKWGFPLLHDAKMLIPWLQLFFKRLRLTSLFVESNLSSGGAATDRESALQDSVDNLFVLDWIAATREMELKCLRKLNAALGSGEDHVTLRTASAAANAEK